MPGEHQQPGRYEFFAAAVPAGEPGAGDGSGEVCTDVVAALCDLA
jgi:hypothetical protein